MKTVLGIYTHNKLSSKEALKKKKYAFNTDQDLKVNDLIESNEFSTPIQIVQVLDKSFNYVNIATGDLSHEITSTNQFPVREIIIRQEKSDVIYGKLLRDEE